jgi:hypothetical protein
MESVRRQVYTEISRIEVKVFQSDRGVHFFRYKDCTHWYWSCFELLAQCGIELWCHANLKNVPGLLTLKMGTVVFVETLYNSQRSTWRIKPESLDFTIHIISEDCIWSVVFGFVFTVSRLWGLLNIQWDGIITCCEFERIVKEDITYCCLYIRTFFNDASSVAQTI